MKYNSSESPSFFFLFFDFIASFCHVVIKYLMVLPVTVAQKNKLFTLNN